MLTENDNLLFFLKKHVAENGDRAYVTYNGHTITYQDAYIEICRIKLFIHTKTPSHDLYIGLNFKDQKKFLLSFWACIALRANIIVIPEMNHELYHATSKNIDVKIDLLLSDLIEGHNCFDINTESYDGLNHSTLFSDVSNAVPSIYFFTSGTTGQSKFIKTTYYQIVKAINCIRENNLMPYTFNQNVYISVPLFHSYGLSSMIEYTDGGSHIFLPKEKFQIGPLQTLLDKLISQQINCIEGVPYFYKQVSVVLDRISMPDLKHIGMGGDTVIYDLLEKINEKKPDITYSIRYGITEIPSVIGLNYFTFNNLSDIKYIGKILPIYKVTLIDKENNINEKEGELRISYLLEHDQEIEIKTGDILEYCDSKMHFKSRTSFIKYKGYKINPVEIETHLNRYDGIFDSKVFISDELLTAEIILMENCNADIPALKIFLSKFINTNTIPEQYRFVKSILRTQSGKLIR